MSTAARPARRPASFSLKIRVFLPRKASSSFKIPCTDERVSLSFSYWRSILSWAEYAPQPRSSAASNFPVPPGISVAMLLQ